MSPKSIEEALECVQGRADIIDVKNPAEGSLGANFPWIIKEIRNKVPEHIPISATIGDIVYKPGTVALAAFGAATSGASFVKVGLWGIENKKQGIEIMNAVKKAIDFNNLETDVVVAGYAEGESIGSINPLLIPDIARDSKSDYAMIDTYDKTAGKSLFDILTIEELEDFITDSRKNNIGVALGGSIQIDHIPILKKLQPDIVGIRGAACEKGDRIEGKIKAELIIDFANNLKK